MSANCTHLDTEEDTCNTSHDSALSRAPTFDSALSNLSSAAMSSLEERGWRLRTAAENDLFLRQSFTQVLQDSALLPPDERLVMYDACDEHEIQTMLGPHLRKRLDARRNTKPKKPDTQHFVCTPFDAHAFNFSKIKNPRERLLKLHLRAGTYSLLTNKFPLFRSHMLLVAEELVPQQMTAGHLSSMTEMLRVTSFCAYFNSWCASASVNHFHCHVIDEFPPVTTYRLVAGMIVCGVRCLMPEGFPGFCYVFSNAQLHLVAEVVTAMQVENQPHNLLFTPTHIYVFPKPLQRPSRSFELYPETVGGPELIGSFTVYLQSDYDSLSTETANELLRINTAPLPSKLLCRGEGEGLGTDDAALHSAVVRAPSIPCSKSSSWARTVSSHLLTVQP